ncbi:MAG: holo-ACP synthase [Defluviitaleaceae bacterium]|nr:holo-ACP synthase [Defluviitaleaceae bacterium]
MSNIKIGTDIIEISRIEKAIKKINFLEKIYTKAEIELINKKGVATAACNFAGKEAVVKALGSGFSGISPKDIEVLRNSSGEPYVKGREDIKISLSHCKEYAIAMVIIV